MDRTVEASGCRIAAGGEQMRYKIALVASDEGYSVSVPGLPGCWSQGATEEEALRNIQDAIQEYLATRDELLVGAIVREVEVAS
jgi:predicted RNase H-like HicB family nuclease